LFTFKQLGLSAPSLRALDAEGYTVPTDIQREAIPHGLAGRDVIGLARTGTGKTAAFALPIIERLIATRMPIAPTACRTLVVAPTRELAAQIAEGFRTYGRFTRLSTTVVFGGTAIGRQIHALSRGVDVLVATPGRLLDLVHARACRLDAVEILVLDEADHMLDLGFIQPLRKIARMLPARRQTLFFSATMPPSIAELAAAFLRDPVRIEVASAAPAERVEQGVIHVDGTLKQALLEAILDDSTISRALVFTRTKHGADRVVKRLAAARIEAQAIHGNKSQPQRERALRAFKDGRARILVATEIAARGIDVDAVSHVINFDLPDVPEQYVHRIGRTARAGAAGVAVSFCAPDERGALRAIERLTKQSVRVIQHPVAQRPAARPASHPATVRSPWRGRVAKNGRAARL
jgi:ATP-dependent RNA helicase RhlE